MKKRQIRKIQEDPSQLSLFRKINEWTTETREIWKWTSVVHTQAHTQFRFSEEAFPQWKVASSSNCAEAEFRIPLWSILWILFYLYFLFNFQFWFLSFIIINIPPRSLNLRASILLPCDSAGSHFPRFCFHGSTLPHFYLRKTATTLFPPPLNSPDSTLTPSSTTRHITSLAGQFRINIRWVISALTYSFATEIIFWNAPSLLEMMDMLLLFRLASMQ